MTRKLGVVATERVAQLRERKANPEKYRPVRTPIQDLNRIMKGGFPKQDPFYTIILGMDKIGKSTLIMQFFLAYAKATGFKAAFYDLEESIWQAADRAMVIPSSTVNRTNIYQVELTDEHLNYMDETAKELQFEELYVEDRLYDVKKIVADALANNFTLIGIDNYQLMLGGQGRDSRERLEDVSKFLMRTCHEKGIIIFMAAQGNTKDGVFGSSQGFRDCDFLLELDYVFQPVEGKRGKGIALEGVRTIRVKRSRHTGTGEIEVIFEPEYSRVKDAQIRILPDFKKEEAEFTQEELDFDEEIRNGQDED